MTKPNFKGKKVLILGLGVNQGGLGAAKFFAKAGAILRITDLKDAQTLKSSLDELKPFPDIEYTLGKHKYEDIDWADLVIKNPALKSDNPYLQYAREKGKQVEMDIGIIIQFISPKQIIGITGTKGKSTTSSLIYEALKSAGKKVVFAGNIGRSVFDTLPHVDKHTVVVLELSSFQLEGLAPHQTSPHVAAITNILPDHLNYYGSMENYTAAKKLIAKYQTEDDYLLINKDDRITSSSEFLEGIKSKIIYFSQDRLPKNFVPNLPGEHNLANYSAALAVTKVLGISEQEASQAINKFQGVEFRQQLVKEWSGVKFYNDTAATGPDAAIAALKTFPDSILIAGGQNANFDYQSLAEAIDTLAKKVYFLKGDATEQIKQLIKNKKLNKGTFDNFDDLLADLKQELQPGETVILSPGAKSFNLFQNEFDRGRKFNKAVNVIFK